MKSMRLASVGIFLMTYFYRSVGRGREGGMALRPNGSATDTCSSSQPPHISTYGRPQVNKFEQVFSLGKQKSLPGDQGPVKWDGKGRALHREVQCIMAMVTWDPPVDSQTDTRLKTSPLGNMPVTVSRLYFTFFMK